MQLMKKEAFTYLRLENETAIKASTVAETARATRFADHQRIVTGLTTLMSQLSRKWINSEVVSRPKSQKISIMAAKREKNSNLLETMNSKPK